MKTLIFACVLFIIGMGLCVKAEADNIPVDLYQHRHVCIRNNATLSVSDTVRCYQGVSFSIQANATLRVKGGTMVDADIKAQTGSNVKIQNNGRIIPRTNRDFYIPIGAKMQINYGRIK